MFRDVRAVGDGRAGGGACPPILISTDQLGGLIMPTILIPPNPNPTPPSGFSDIPTALDVVWRHLHLKISMLSSNEMFTLQEVKVRKSQKHFFLIKVKFAQVNHELISFAFDKKWKIRKTELTYMLYKLLNQMWAYFFQFTTFFIN